MTKRYVDISTHIIPNIKDYNKTIEESLEMVNKLKKDNTIDVIVTPSIDNNVSFSDRKNIRSNFNYLIKQVSLAKIDINLYLGYQVLITKEFNLDLSEFTIANTKYLLLEFNTIKELDIEEVILEIIKKGFKPIISSVEKYQYLTFNIIKRLKQMGCLIAVNANAVIGERGKVDQKHIERLLEQKLVDIIASDATNNTNRKPQVKEAYTYLVDKLERNYLEQIVYLNANKIISNIKSMR